MLKSIWFERKKILINKKKYFFIFFTLIKFVPQDIDKLVGNHYTKMPNFSLKMEYECEIQKQIFRLHIWILIVEYISTFSLSLCALTFEKNIDFSMLWYFEIIFWNPQLELTIYISELFSRFHWNCSAFTSMIHMREN